jgi:hypothetical protein
MLMRLFPISAALSLLAAGLACEPAQPAAPTAAEPSATPSFGTSNGPANPGNGHSFIIRSLDEFFLSTVDEEQDLVVRHYNTEDIDFCGGSTPVPLAEAQLKLTPGAAIYHWKTGFIPVYIYRLSELPPQDVSPEFCAALKTAWIYRGMHHLRNHDNNLFFDPSRNNSFGWNAQGKVFDRAGVQHSYKESLQVVADPEPFRIVHENYRLSIR